MLRIAWALGACLAGALAASCAMPPPPVAPVVQPAAAEAPPAPAPALESQALAHIERLRAIRPGADEQLARQYNRQLEEAWKFFIANPAVMPVLRRTLAREVTLSERNDFILLDLGYFLHGRGTPDDRAVAKSALFALDPRAEIVRYNQQELFQFAHAVAAERDARILPFLDKVFLREPVAVRIPEANMSLDPSLVCAFLYGAYGAGAEAHLKAHLSDRKLARKVIEILVWIGTPASNAAVKDVLMGASRDYETFVRAATFLLKSGGPQGRAVVLAVQASALDPWTSNYYDQIRAPALAISFGTLRRQLVPAPTAEALGDAELRRRLLAIGTAAGKAADPSTQAILDSRLPREEVIEEVARAHGRLLRGVSAEAPAEIQRLNAILNALRYRDQ